MSQQHPASPYVTRSVVRSVSQTLAAGAAKIARWRGKAALLLALGCGFLVCSAAMAAAPIAPRLLVARTHDLPGFAGARTGLESTTSPNVYVKEYTQDTPAEATAQLSGLIRMGFQEGVQGTFSAPHREAVSEAIVFRSAQAAGEEVKAAVAEDLAAFEKSGLKRSPVPGLPGAVALGDFHAGHRGATDNVLFSSGRCFLSVSDRVLNATTRAQAAIAPVAAAKALSNRVKHTCA